MVPRGHYLHPDQKMNCCCTMCEATHWSSFFYMMYRAAARRALIVLFMPAFCFCRGSSLICAHMRVNLFLFWHEENMMYSWSRYFLDNTLSLSHTHTLTHTHTVTEGGSQGLMASPRMGSNLIFDMHIHRGDCTFNTSIIKFTVNL